MEKLELPEGWEWVQISDVAVVSPKIPNRDEISDDLEVQFLPMKLVEETNGKIHLIETRKYGDVKKGYTPFINGDIIFAKVTPCMENGKIAVVDNLLNGIGFGSSEFHVIRPNESLLSKYIFNYIVQEKFRNEAEREMTGAVGLRRVPKQFIENYRIPLPPLPTQQAIVAKIEQLLSELDQGKQQLETAQQQLKVYRQAVLKWAIIGKAAYPIESVIESLDQGWSPKCHNEPSESINEWAVIKTTAIQAGYFLDNENKRLPEDLTPRKQHELRKGDLLITRAGPRVRAGICCLVKKTRPKLLNCDKVYRIRINAKIAMPEYIEFLLNSPKYAREIEKLKTGISDSGVNLTQKGFVKILIPLPPLPEQHRIVQEIESRLSVCDKIEETIGQSPRQAETLRQSILQRAFAGRLV